MNVKTKMTDCSKLPRCADERNPSSAKNAKNRVPMAIPSVGITDENTKHQTCHLRGEALQELTKITRSFCHWSEQEILVTTKGSQHAAAVLGSGAQNNRAASQKPFEH